MEPLDVLDYFLSLVLGLGLFLGLAFGVAFGVMKAADWYFGDPRNVDPWAERTMRPRGCDVCQSCGRPVLVENTTRGICADCLMVLDEIAYAQFVHHQNDDDDRYSPTEEEWTALMRAIDDEKLDVEDHR